MNITKIEDGLLEQDDYFLTSRTTEFLGEHVFSRKNDELELISGYLERNFTYKDYVIMVDKKNNALVADSKISLYTRKESRRNVVQEVYSGNTQDSATNWKMIQYDGFLQTYVSYDNKSTWIATGGGQIREYTDIQGFYVEGSIPLKLTRYRVYRNPYVRLFDIPHNYTVKLVDENGKELDSQKSDYGEVKFFLHDEVKAKFVFYNEQDVFVEETVVLDLKLGDSYVDLQYDIDLYYGNLIEKWSTTKLNSLEEKLQIKNNSMAETYTNVTLTPVHTNRDTIQLSLDGKSYSDAITIPSLAPQELKDFYIKITKDRTDSSFGKRSFVLEIQ